MEDTKVQEAKDRLLMFMPYIRNAIKEADAGGVTKLGILSYFPDGAGKIQAAFEFEEFFEDIALVIGAPAFTEEDEMKAKAHGLLSRLGLK